MNCFSKISTLILVQWTLGSYAVCDPDLFKQVVQDNQFTRTRDFKLYAQLESGSRGSPQNVSRLSDEVSKLGKNDHLIDMGSGESNFLEDVARTYREAGIQAPKLTGITFKIERDKEMLKTLGVRILSDRFVEDIPDSEIGKATLITDLYGPYTYSPKPDRILQKYLDLLNPGGSMYVMIGLEREHSRSKVQTPTGEIPLHEWLIQNTKGIEVERLVTDYAGYKLLSLRIKKTKNEVTVPKLGLLSSSEGYDSPIPSRTYTSNTSIKPKPPNFDIYSLALVTPSIREQLSSALNTNVIGKVTGIHTNDSYVIDEIFATQEEQKNFTDWTILNYSITNSAGIQGLVQIGRQNIESMSYYRVHSGEKVAQVLFLADFGEKLEKLKEIGKMSIKHSFEGLDLNRIVTKAPRVSSAFRTELEKLGFTLLPSNSDSDDVYYELKRK